MFGEYQPKFANEYQSAKNRKPDCRPIPDYYLPVITEAEFYQLQAGLESRRENAAFGTGRKSAKVTNLFGTMIKDVVTRSTMCRLDKGKKSIPCLISAECKSGIGERITSPYEDFESHFLAWLRELPSAQLLDNKSSESEKRLTVVRGKIQEVSAKLAKMKTRLLEEADIDTLVDMVRTLETQLKELRKEQESLKAESSITNPIGECQSVLTLLDGVKVDELTELRSRVRFLLAELISTIFVSIKRDGQSRKLFSQIHFRNGKVRRMVVLSYIKYVWGGSDNPKPVRQSSSMSSPAMQLEGRPPKDWLGNFRLARPVA